MDKATMARAFNEWMRRFTEEPQRFEREYQTVAAYQADKNEGREPSYGEICASYLEELAASL